VADARCLHFNENFAWTRCVEVGGFDGQRLPLLPENRGLNVHGINVGARLYRRMADDCKVVQKPLGRIQKLSCHVPPAGTLWSSL